MSRMGAAAIDQAGALAVAAMNNGVNYKINKETNESNRQIADATNKANRDLAEQQFGYEKEMWQMQNEYNDPSAQVQRYAAAGINPLSAMSSGGLSNGNASAPPSVPDMANQVTGAPMVAPTLDPLTWDDTFFKAIDAQKNYEVNKYNAETSRLTAESTIKVNEWSVKSVQQQISNMQTQQHIDLTMLPYMIREKRAVIDDHRSSKKLKDAQTDAIDTTIELGKAQIFSTYSSVLQKWFQIDIEQQNADTNKRNADINQQNADTAAKNAQTQAESVANSYDIALKGYQQKSLDQLLDFAKTFKQDEKSFKRYSGQLQSSFGIGGKGGIPGFNASGSLGHDSGSESSSSSLDLEHAMKSFGQLCAYNVALLDYIKNPSTSPSDRQKCLQTLTLTQSLMNGEEVTMGHRIRSNQTFRQAMMQYPIDLIQNPMNSDTFQ